jgi:peptide/nickel transport system substrate-binding protein
MMVAIGRLAWLVVALTLVAPLPAAAGKRDNTLRWVSTFSIASGEPYYNSFREGVLFIGQMVWDTLIHRDPDTSAYKPLLATAWRWIDPTTLELDLRTDVTFHDGRAFSADDVVYTINYVIDPANKVTNPSNVNWIQRAEKTASHQVRLVLKAPFPAAIEYLSGPIAILPVDFYKDAGADRLVPAARLIGTGPYRFTRWEPGKEGQFDANTSYMADSPKGRPAIPRVVMRVIPDAATQMAELMAGRVDWIGQLPEDAGRQLASVPNISMLASETMRIIFLQFDVQGRSGANPFQDLRVRQAVAHAINREAIVANLIGAGSRVWHAFCFETQVGCMTDVRRYAYDPTRAKELLAEAGFPNGFETEILGFRARPRIEALNGFLTASGIRTRLQFMAYSAVRDRQHKGQARFVDTSWGSYSVNDASAMINPFFTHLPDDMVHDAEIKTWADQASRTIDPDERKQLYGQILRKIADNVYVLPLYTNPSVAAFTSDLAFRTWPDENPRFYMQRWR